MHTFASTQRVTFHEARDPIHLCISGKEWTKDDMNSKISNALFLPRIYSG